MQLQSKGFIYQLIGIVIQRIAYVALAPALKKAGRESEARMLECADKQVRQDLQRRRATTALSSSYTWSVLLVNLSVGLVAVFLPITLVTVLYVNAKLWVRKDRKGSVYELFTTAENYLPILLFLSCLALYVAYVPFGQNFAHLMTTTDTIDTFSPWFLRTGFPCLGRIRIHSPPALA